MQTKKLYSIIFLPLLSLYADTCYSVELWSVKAQNSTPLQTEKECQNLHIGDYIASRCGCFEDILDAKEKLQEYKLLYPNAYVTKTRRSRFKTTPTVETPIRKELEEEEVATTVDINSSFRFETTQNEANNLLESDEDIEKLSQSNANVNTAFSENSVFYGLSLEGKYEQYLNQDYVMRDYTDYEYELKLKFSLFKDGFFEHKKENEKDAKGANVIYLQNLSVVLKNSVQETQLFIDSLNSELNYKYYTELSELYQGAMQKSKAKLDDAIIQSYRYDLLEQKYQRFFKSSKVYERHPRVALDEKIASLMNDIESIKLKEKEKVIAYSKENSYDISLQNAKIQLLDEPVNYLDNVNMNLYAHRRRVDELGWYNTVGVEAKIPLDFSSSEDASMQKLERNSHELVNKSLEKNIQKRVEALYLNFTDLQDFIAIDSDDIQATKKRVKKFKEIERNIIPNLNFDPDEEILKAQREIIDLKFNILFTKVKLLKILTEIAHIGNMKDISQIIEPKSQI